MADLHFPICTPDIPPMLGRTRIMGQLIAELTKTTPSHRSVVGPRFSGKSVILKQLAKEMRASASPYCCVIEWDLGHGTPQTDAEFLTQLCSRLGDGLGAAGLSDYGDHLKGVSEGHYAEICEVLDCLETDGVKALMIWDGFDKPLSIGSLTRNLWDSLRELCLKPSVRLVVATRRELHDLIRDEHSVTSDFWNIFGDIVRVGPFGDEDVESVLASLSGHTFQSGAKSEILNWTGGNAPLILSLLNAICNRKQSGTVTNADVNAAAEAMLDSLDPILADMWQDCTVSARDLYAFMLDGGDATMATTGKEDRQELAARGFIIISSQKVKSSCRLLERHLHDAGPDAGSMARLFGSWDAYQANIRAFLERRLSYLVRFDDRLFRLVSRAIEDIPGYPDDCLNNLTGIRDRALAIIWHRECTSSGEFSPDVIAHWSSAPRDSERLIREMMDRDEWHVPPDPSLQLRVLQYLTGSYQNFASKAVATSKDTYVLLNAIHSYRNRNQHAGGQEMHLGVAVAAMMTCIELLACLDRDTPAP